MPELPDVEVFRRYVDATSLRRRVEHARVVDEGILEGATRQGASAALVGEPLEGTARHGKLLGVASASGRWLVLHFGMTGLVRAWEGDGEAPEHTALVLELAGGRRLAYTNRRRLGRISVAEDSGAFVEAQGLGPDAMSVDAESFAGLVRGRGGTIKSLLMNQGAIAGVGNVYVDEALFHAGIHPDRSAGEVSGEEARGLRGHLVRVLETAIDRRAQPGEMPGSWLLPRREEGTWCPRCGGTIERMQVRGRSSYWRPGCQS